MPKTKISLKKAETIADQLVSDLKKLKLTGIVIAGSIRRQQETIGDIDLMVRGTLEKIKTLKKIDFVRGGEANCTFNFKGIQVNVYKYETAYKGAMLMFLTGPKWRNIAYRKIAQKQGLKLSQYGLFKGDKFIAGKTERQIYTAMGKHYKAPELR